MPNTTILASGAIPPQGDQLTVELIGADPPGGPASVAIRWPSKPTIATPAGLDNVLAVVMRILANSSTELAALRRGKKKL
jgi:hypothetical protein